MLSNRGLSAIRAAAAAVGDFPLLDVLAAAEDVVDDHPAFEAGTGHSRQACPQQRGARNTRDGASGLPTSLLCKTHFPGATRREKWLLTAPVGPVVVISVVGDLVPATPVGLDRPDLVVGSGVVDKGYLLT